MTDEADKRIIFVTIVSKGDDRGEAEIREAWERALRGVVAPGIERVAKVTVLSDVAPGPEEQRQPARISPPKMSLRVREDRAPPKFYYSVDERQWWEIPGELTKVWQLRFMPRDIGLRDGVILVRGEIGDQRVESRIRIKSTEQQVLELAEP